MPSAYNKGHKKACIFNKTLADNYIRHTTIGDPVLDPLMKELSSLPPDDLHRFIGAGIEENEKALFKAPRVLRDFFKNLEDPPWLNHDAFRPGVHAFNLNTTQVLIAFVCGVLVEGFSTLISKSFITTGRVQNENTAIRRLSQNNLHLMEVFFPDGLKRGYDGWKLSMRLRFVHARVRNLLTKSGYWNHGAWGTPISAAHLGFAITVFSMRLLKSALLVGATFDKKEQESVMDIWRYTGYVMGIPESILYTNKKEAQDIFNIAHMCEPSPDDDSITMANAFIKAVPLTAGIKDPTEQKALETLAYSLSRPLIGNKLANQLQFPKTNTYGTLFAYRMKQRLQQFWKGEQVVRLENFCQLLQISICNKSGMSYKMPDHVKNSKSSAW